MEMLSDEIQGAADRMFLAGDLYTKAKRADQALVIYQNIMRTFPGLVYPGYRDRAKMEIDILDRGR